MKKKSFGILLGFIVIVIGISLIFNKKSNSDKELSFYLDNEITEVIPKKGEALFSKAVCDNDTKASWNNENWSLEVINLSRKTKCNLYFGSYTGETVFNFDYTGAEQIFTAPVSGTYKLEIWGAQGGNSTDGKTGGNGGYASGIVKLAEKNNLYLNVGSMGSYGQNSIGGYNGGGSSEYTTSGSGGGATHIATKSGLLATLEDYKNDILIVSGGGGGGTIDRIGGDGGGFCGADGLNGTTGIAAGLGGMQTNGGTGSSNSGTFGSGGNGNAAGGGGGYYCGGSTKIGYGMDSSAGGGSGYIGNPLLTEKVMYCYNCKESDEESTKTISTTCNEETPTENCSKKGNGYARITLISIDT